MTKKELESKLANDLRILRAVEYNLLRCERRLENLEVKNISDLLATGLNEQTLGTIKKILSNDSELDTLTLREIYPVAASLGIKYLTRFKKRELIYEINRRRTKNEKASQANNVG